MHRNDLIPTDAAAVTKGDGTAVNFVGLYVGGAGDVVVKTGAGNVVTFSSVPAGTLLPLRIVEVRTATTATSMTGLIA